MATAQYALVFVRPPRERLPAAARLVTELPLFLGGADGELDLHHCVATGYTAAVVRAAREAFTPEVLARLAFWIARAGAQPILIEALPEEKRVRLAADIARCERTLTATPLAEAPAAASQFFRAFGVTSQPSAGARPLLAVDLDGPGAEGIVYRPEARALFVAGVLAPPCGDQLALSVRHDGAPGPVEGWAAVAEVRSRRDAGPGRPAGFTLRVEGPAALHEILAQHARRQTGRDTRAAPRFPVKAPVRVTPALAGSAAAALSTAAAPFPIPAPRARLEYATDQELAADWIENLSHGGAFVRTATPQPVGTELAFELALPDGARLEAKAVVAFTNAKGMGLQFRLSQEQDALLSAAIARISARPRRALVVDDDALARQLLSDALTARGFEVLTAADGDAGLHVLLDELLALDLLVTDVVMRRRSGEDLIKTIREAGGEAELAIVVVSGFLEPGVERALERAGADAVLDKALGAELVAQAADAVLERKRLVQQASAA